MILLFTFIFSEHYKIELANSKKYIQGTTLLDKIANLVDFQDSTSFTFNADDQLSENNVIAISDFSDVIMKVDPSKDKIVFGPFTKSQNALFRFVPLDFNEKTNWIVNKKKCVTWDPKNLYFSMKECDLENEKQRFFILNLYLGNSDINLNLKERKEFLIQKAIKSHYMENEGERIISNIYNILDALEICFEKNNVCNFSCDYLQKLYDDKGYKGFVEESEALPCSCSK